MKKLLGAALFWMLTALAVAQTPTAAVTVVGPDGRSTPVTAQALGALPRETLTETDHGKQTVFTGSDLRELLRALEIEPPERVRGPLMRRAILVQGADGYAVVFAFAELDPTLGGRRIHLVDRVDDKPLAAEDGPWRLVVSGDARGGRWVRQVVRISIIDVK